MEKTKTAGSTTEQLEKQEKLISNELEFVAIKDEEYRFYDIPIGKGGTTVRVRIENPNWLFVRPSGSHLVIDKEGVTHYIPNTFVHLAWHNSTEDTPANF